jgi:hypothetical protein
VPEMAFSVVPQHHGFLVCFSRIFWMILKWSQLLQLLLVSPSFYIPHALYFYCEVFIF